MWQLRRVILLSMIVCCASLAASKKALIFGVTGQDGTYLAEFLLEKGYEVHGVKRNSSISNTERLHHLLQNTVYHKRLFLHYGDLSDSSSINTLIQSVDPDEVYNLAAQSQVRISFDLPEQTAEVNALGVLKILEAIRKSQKGKHIRFYQASTSEMFGTSCQENQCETTPFCPRSPYAISKLFAYWTTVNYREAYSIFACNGILFNHESPIRGETFVTRKISLAVAKHYIGEGSILYLGNLDAGRDWGYAKDYVKAMWLMMQQESSDDYVIATGQTHTVREFVELAFKEINIEIQWKGKGIDEVGCDAKNGEVIVKINPHYFRPTEVDMLCGNAKKAFQHLQWKPSVSFKELVKIMVNEDIQRLLKNKDY